MKNELTKTAAKEIADGLNKIGISITIRPPLFIEFDNSTVPTTLRAAIWKGDAIEAKFRLACNSMGARCITQNVEPAPVLTSNIGKYDALDKETDRRLENIIISEAVMPKLVEFIQALHKKGVELESEIFAYLI